MVGSRGAVRYTGGQVRLCRRRCDLVSEVGAEWEGIGKRQLACTAAEDRRGAGADGSKENEKLMCACEPPTWVPHELIAELSVS